MVTSNRPHLIILDTHLPGDLDAEPPDTGDGFECARDLREDPKTAELPVILLAARSAVAEPLRRDTRAFLEQQGRPYVWEPFNPIVVLGLVKKLLEPDEHEPPPWGSHF